MVISLNIPDSAEKLLVEQATKRGVSVESYAVDLIQKGVSGGQTFDEILAPFRNQVTASGISDHELTSLFEIARSQAFELKQGE